MFTILYPYGSRKQDEVLVDGEYGGMILSGRYGWIDFGGEGGSFCFDPSVPVCVIHRGNDGRRHERVERYPPEVSDE